ncbi:SDR family NAD(P)-dependent oxidoreductase [Tessaracoccus coleopterorum]|uniref:SDR family NAD(P)-dependent oxidoreductase n=1 Tax=Tessaracoccus coleopterorum TaxID=2714950 RepID=UPI0018D41D39|nr:SDR family NAD(P)-dependent oxidoreductase [Tessaracoccus coleopterorum]
MTRRAIVTGHSRGLGAAVTAALTADGWDVLGVSRSAGERVDLADPTALATWLDGPTVADFLAGADEVLLINNAGLLGPATVAGPQEAASVTAAVNVNVTAPILLTNAVLAARPDGVPVRIVHVSSGAGRRPIVGWSVYCATKAAVDQHALTVAAERLPGCGSRPSRRAWSTRRCRPRSAARRTSRVAPTSSP